MKNCFAQKKKEKEKEKFVVEGEGKKGVKRLYEGSSGRLSSLMLVDRNCLLVLWYESVYSCIFCQKVEG